LENINFISALFCSGRALWIPNFLSSPYPKKTRVVLFTTGCLETTFYTLGVQATLRPSRRTYKERSVVVSEQHAGDVRYLPRHSVPGGRFSNCPLHSPLHSQPSLGYSGHNGGQCCHPNLAANRARSWKHSAVAYKLGAVTVGGSLLWVGEELGHSLMWLLFASLYMFAVCLVLSLNLIQNDQQNKKEDYTSTLTMIRENLSRIFKVEGTMWMISILLFYKLCERGEAVFPIYLVDKKIPLQRLAFWNGVIRSIASISGSALSGVLLSSREWKPRRVLLSFSMLRIAPILFQTLLIKVWGFNSVDVQDLDRWSSQSCFFYASILSLCVGNFCAGALTTAAFTAMMNLSQGAPESIRSTHYSLLATVEVLGKLSFATVCGLLIDEAGLLVMFSLFTCFAALTVPLLMKMPKEDRLITKE